MSRDPVDESGTCPCCADLLETPFEVDAALCSFCYHGEEENDFDYEEDERCSCGEWLEEDGSCPVCEPW